MTNDIEFYLNSKDWTFKFRNGEYCLDQCPLCNAGPGHFYINQSKEIFYCHKCGERGHLLSLKKRLGDLPTVSHVSRYSKASTPSKIIDSSTIEKYHKYLLENPVALAYLQEQRAFTLEIIKKFKLGFNDGSVTIPYFGDGICLNVKSRPINPGDQKYFREEGCRSILFNLDNARKYQGALIITEGEFDAIAFEQMGFPNVVSVPNGAEAFSDEWIDDLETFDQIYLSYDMDEPGRKGIEKAADKLGRYRCLDIHLPLKDANDCLKAGFTNQEIVGILAKAKSFGSKLIKSPEAFLNEIQDLHSGQSFSKGTLTGWKRFDDLLGGLRFNELTVLTGETASGKTTWAANLGFRLTKENHPVLIASFEMKPLTILKKMIQMEAGYPFFELSKKEVGSSLKAISERPIYFIDVYGEIGIKELKDSIYYAKRRHGIEFIILDHLHFFLRYSGDQERQAIDQALRDIKSWAMELDIHILLIVHPTKLTYDNKVVHLNDLKGSSGLKQIPDNVFSIWRPRGENNSKNSQPDNEVLLYLLKVRDDSGDEGNVILTFDKRSQSYEDSGSGFMKPSEGRRNPEPSSPNSRSFSGKDLASGYDS
jgi:twinkle protein